MNLKFSIVAEREIETAADYYEKQEDGLGLRFVLELQTRDQVYSSIPECMVPHFQASSALRAATLSLQCYLLCATRHSHDRNSGSSTPRPGEMANAAQRAGTLESVPPFLIDARVRRTLHRSR